MERSIRAIVFDIGGVLVNVAKTWEEAARHAGVELPPIATDAVSDSARRDPGRTALTPRQSHNSPLDDAPGFQLFQDGQLSIEAFLDGLAEYLGIGADQALKVHDHILMDGIAGTLEIVCSLNEAGFVTACLSNTNTPHWTELTRSDRFPNIAALKVLTASQILGVSKPDLRIYREFERLVGLSPAGILFFDDSALNVEGARSCGWDAVTVDAAGPQSSQIRASLVARGIDT